MSDLPQYTPILDESGHSIGAVGIEPALAAANVEIARLRTQVTELSKAIVRVTTRAESAEAALRAAHAQPGGSR